MPFSNKRNSRDDNSKQRRRSTSNHPRAKGRNFAKQRTTDDEQWQPNTGSSRFSGKRKNTDTSTLRDGTQRRSGQYTSDRSERRPYGNKPYDPSKKRRERTEIRKNPPVDSRTQDDGLIRLNRYIANAGVCSRRKADELIEAGVITVNGEVVTELGSKVDPAKDDVRYNGERLKREKMVYILLNKPKDYITTTDDPQERRTVMQLVANASRERIYPVGRLDRNTTGLLLLTNDGNLAEKLSHPRNNVAKIYNVEMDKNLTQGDLNKIAFGLELEDGFV